MPAVYFCLFFFLCLYMQFLESEFDLKQMSFHQILFMLSRYQIESLKMNWFLRNVTLSNIAHAFPVTNRNLENKFDFKEMSLHQILLMLSRYKTYRLKMNLISKKFQRNLILLMLSRFQSKSFLSTFFWKYVPCISEHFLPFICKWHSDSSYRPMQ